MRRVLSVAVTERGSALAERLPYERARGSLAAAVRRHWDEVDGFVLFAAVGACVRIVGPLLADKETDPAVVCVDDAGRFAVALLGGHAAGANDLARDVAARLGAEAVVTTATDVTGKVAIDQLPGFAAEGDLAAVTRTLLDGEAVEVSNELDWPLPASLRAALAAGQGAAGQRVAGEGRVLPRIVVTDREVALEQGVVLLRPPSLVAGIGASSEPPAQELAELLAEALLQAGLSRRNLRCVATIDRRAGSPALCSLGLPITAYTSEELAAVEVPNPSEAVRAAVGTPSVAEAAALLGAGEGATLALPKLVSEHATVALARAARPKGRIAVVGLGPGGPGSRTTDAEVAVRSAEVVVGFEGYLAQCGDLLLPAQEIVPSPIGAELQRARSAVTAAAGGASVAVVCSGDPGVYAMASLVLEEAGGTGIATTIVPGVTAALAAAAQLGAPLGHDHAVVSLSDLLTPWEVIVARVTAARDADLVLALYNPRSTKRDWQLGAVKDLLLERRSPSTPVGLVTQAGRPGARTSITTLADLDPGSAGMTTCVIVGSSTTRVIDGRMVTPRGYRRQPVPPEGAQAEELAMPVSVRPGTGAEAATRIT